MRVELRQFEFSEKRVLVIHVKKWRRIYWAFNYTFARMDSPILEMMIEAPFDRPINQQEVL